MNCKNTAGIPSQVKSDTDIVVDEVHEMILNDDDIDDHVNNIECDLDFSIPLKVNDAKKPL